MRRHDAPLHGYEIHHGQVSRSADDDWLGVGIRNAAVYGTHWHGLLDNDEVRRRWLADAAEAAGRRGFTVAADVDVSARRDAQLDLMADLLAASVDIDAILGLLENGAAAQADDRQRAASVALALMISRYAGASALALLVTMAFTGCASTVAGTATWPGAKLDRTILTADDFPKGVQYDRIIEKPGQADGEGGPPAMLSKPEGCSDGLTRVIAASAERGRAAPRSTASPTTARAS